MFLGYLTDKRSDPLKCSFLRSQTCKLCILQNQDIGHFPFTVQNRSVILLVKEIKRSFPTDFIQC